MKKMIASLLISGVLFASCKKDKGVDCMAAVNKATKASETYFGSQTKENCDAYKAAMQEYINSSCFTSLTQEQKNSYNESLNSIDCAE